MTSLTFTYKCVEVNTAKVADSTNEVFVEGRARGSRYAGLTACHFLFLYTADSLLSPSNDNEVPTALS